MLFRLLLLVAAACYYAAYRLHHRTCLRPGKPLVHASLFVIGSFRIGGAGKTPFTAWLAQFILENARCAATDASSPDAAGNDSATGNKDAAPRIAILCHSKAADEAEMLRQKFAGKPQVRVIATPNRYHTAHELDGAFDYIICDDGFEDTRLAGATTIRLDRDGTPQRIADLVPAGKNRSLMQDHDAPAFVLGPSDIEFRIAQVTNAAGQPCPVNPVAICGIGDSARFASDLNAFGIFPAKFIARPDHDRHFEQTFRKLLEKGGPLVTTEKDLARLPRELRVHRSVFVAYQQVSLSDTAISGVRQAIASRR